MKNKIAQINDNMKKILITIAAKRFSRKEKIIIIIFACMLFISAYLSLNAWISKIKKATHVLQPTAPAKNASETAPDNRPPQKRAAQTAAEPEIKMRDPFLGSLDEDAGPESPTVDLSVSGILWDEKIPTAIINSKVVKIGDAIYGKTVVDIEKDRVVVMENGQIYVLQLNKQ